AQAPFRFSLIERLQGLNKRVLRARRPNDDARSLPDLFHVGRVPRIHRRAWRKPGGAEPSGRRNLPIRTAARNSRLRRSESAAATAATTIAATAATAIAATLAAATTSVGGDF